MSNVEPWEIWQLPGGCLLYLHSRFGRLPDEEPREAPFSMMPFGKYRGAPLDAVLDDIAYVEWLLGQRWFGEKFPQQRRYLSNRLWKARDDAEGPSAA